LEIVFRCSDLAVDSPDPLDRLTGDANLLDRS
jgi:hypothetical protein